MITPTIIHPEPPLIVHSYDPMAYAMDVYFNDKLSNEFLFVNQIKGYGIRYKRSASGMLIKKNDEFATEKVRGKFVVKWREGYPV